MPHQLKSIKGLGVSTVLLALLLSPVLDAAPVDLSTTSVQRWSDEVFGAALREGRLSGLGVVAVQAGKVTFATGYGFADANLKRPVDPDTTRFRIGSISKTFTALGISLLLQDRKLGSVDDPANRYLHRVQLPRVRGREITVLDLLTHRGGFEGINWVYDPSPPPLTPEEIQKNLPRVQVSSSDVSIYCNVCTAILGILIEDTTGQLLQDFLDERVFQPLGMERTLLNTSRSPSVGAGAPFVATNGKPVRVPYPAIPEFYAPAGSVDASLSDMARYMIANLGGKGSELLAPELWQAMFTPQARNASAGSAFGFVWMLHEWNGTRVFEHGGQIMGGYHSILALFPDSDAGIFISCFCTPSTVPPAPGAAYELTGFNFREMIYREFLGEPASEMMPIGNLSEYTGTYEVEGSDSRWPLEFARLLSVLTPRNGFLTVTAGAGGLLLDGKGPYVPVRPDVFRYAGLNGGDRYVPFPNRDSLIFIRDTEGEVQRATQALSLGTAKRIGGLDRADLQLGIAIVATVLCALGFLTFYWRLGNDLTSRFVRASSWVTATAAIVALGMFTTAFVAGWYHFGMTTLGMSALQLLLGTVAALLAVAAGASVASAILLLRKNAVPNSGRGCLMRLHAAAVASGALTLTIVLVH
jgi:CubicO group peptidase (beta-lactamase class C family)